MMNSSFHSQKLFPLILKSNIFVLMGMKKSVSIEYGYFFLELTSYSKQLKLSLKQVPGYSGFCFGRYLLF